MKLGYILLYVDDVPRTAQFYERAFGIETAFLHESGAYAEMDTGDTRLGFVNHELARESAEYSPVTPSARAPGIEVAFTTADLDAAYARAIAAGATAVLAPKAKPWGQRVAYVRDPQGFLVELCTPMVNAESPA